MSPLSGGPGFHGGRDVEIVQLRPLLRAGPSARGTSVGNAIADVHARGLSGETSSSAFGPSLALSTPIRYAEIRRGAKLAATSVVKESA